MDFIYRVLALTSPFAVLYPFIISILSYKRQGRPLRIIGLHLFIVAIVEVITHLLWLQKKNNLFLLHIYTLYEFAIISLFYYSLFKKSINKWVMFALLVLFIASVLIDGLFIHGFQNFNIYARSIECILIIGYAIYYFYKRLSDNSLKVFFKDSLLLINSAFLFYFSSSLFLFLFSNIIVDDIVTRHLLWSLHTITLWILYTTIGIALWKAGKS